MLASMMIVSFSRNSQRPQIIARSNEASSTASTRTRRNVRRKWRALLRRSVVTGSRRRGNSGRRGRGAGRMRAFVSSGGSRSCGIGSLRSSSSSSSSICRRKPGLASSYAIVLLLMLLILLHESALILGSRCDCGRTNTAFIVGPRKSPRPSGGDARFILHR